MQNARVRDLSSVVMANYANESRMNGGPTIQYSEKYADDISISHSDKHWLLLLFKLLFTDQRIQQPLMDSFQILFTGPTVSKRTRSLVKPRRLIRSGSFVTEISEQALRLFFRYLKKKILDQSILKTFLLISETEGLMIGLRTSECHFTIELNATNDWKLRSERVCSCGVIIK